MGHYVHQRWNSCKQHISKDHSNRSKKRSLCLNLLRQDKFHRNCKCSVILAIFFSCGVWGRGNKYTLNLKLSIKQLCLYILVYKLGKKLNPYICNTKDNTHLKLQMINHISAHIGVISIGKQPAAYLA